jgi:hypothetical protein
MQAQLDPTGKPIRLEGITVRTPGLGGTVVTIPAPSRRSVRGAGATSEFDRVLQRSGMQTTHLVSLDLTAQATGRRGRSRGEAGPPHRAIVLDVPAPAKGWEQVVVAVDEHGVATWHFGQGSPAGGPRTRGTPAGTRRYVLPHHEAVRPKTPDGRPTTRSLLGDIGKRIVKVIAFPVGKYVGAKARELVRDWENKNRPNGLRTFTPEDRGALVPYFPSNAAAWRDLAKGRALLFIHGTFSRSHSGLGALPPDVLKSLHDAYGGRVFAFDHRTISDSPSENVRWFFDQIPASVKLDLDIVCHSRGGLVARTLAERGAELGNDGKVTVHRIALVAVPSEGTILADVNHWNSLIDTMTSLLNLAGGPGFGDVLETILAFVRQIVVAGYPEIAGLSCMVPGGTYLAGLNGDKRKKLTYLGIIADFEPHNADFAALVKDEALDRLHDGPNDTLVRIDSALGSDRQPAPFQGVDERIVLTGPDGVDHSAYFGQPALMRQMADWLKAGTR